MSLIFEEPIIHYVGIFESYIEIRNFYFDACSDNLFTISFKEAVIEGIRPHVLYEGNITIFDCRK